MKLWEITRPYFQFNIEWMELYGIREQRLVNASCPGCQPVVLIVYREWHYTGLSNMFDNLSNVTEVLITDGIGWRLLNSDVSIATIQHMYMLGMKFDPTIHIAQPITPVDEKPSASPDLPTIRAAVIKLLRVDQL